MTLTAAITLNAIIATILVYSVVALLAKAIVDDRTSRARHQTARRTGVTERGRLAA